jgi:hypothetical protein
VESLTWALKAHDRFQIAWPVFVALTIGFILVQSDFVGLLLVFFSRLTLFGRRDSFRNLSANTCPSGLVIIPSLLRNRDDFKAITTTVESCARNGYPGELVIVVSVDGRTEEPDLYRSLCSWLAALSRPHNVHIHIGGTETRLGKMMAVEAGAHLMKTLVAKGQYPAFPRLYFSIDGDGSLGPECLERLAARITRPHLWTGNLRRVVSGKICIHPNLFWKGWKQFFPYFFTVKGQIYIQVAREFVLSNIARYNWKLTPQIGIPGALYCTWSELLLEAPRYMGFMKTLRFSQWLRWLAGAAPPQFSTSEVTPCPEALTGASDDTCIAFLASMATWQKGKLSLDAPRTPLHALGRLIQSYFFERSHDYEPEARVYTYSPSTIKALWIQRVRWNSSRFECAGRFWRAFAFHWEIGFPTVSHLWLVIRTVFELTLYYILLPYYLVGTSNGVLIYVLGYAGQTFAYSLYTGFALLLEKEWRKFLPVMLCLPLAPLYLIAINFMACAYGVIKDVFLFGAETNFAPEWTLIKGKTERVAILFRLRRFVVLSLRAVVFGDVPWGRFWLGWDETPWTPSGYEGWTTRRKPRGILPPLFGRRGEES